MTTFKQKKGNALAMKQHLKRCLPKPKTNLGGEGGDWDHLPILFPKEMHFSFLSDHHDQQHKGVIQVCVSQANFVKKLIKESTIDTF
jgi:hypothetical protein